MQVSHEHGPPLSREKVMASIFTRVTSAAIIFRDNVESYILFSSAHNPEMSEVRMPDWMGIADAAQLTYVTKGRPNDYRQLYVHVTVSTGFCMPSCFFFLLFREWICGRVEEGSYLPPSRSLNPSLCMVFRGSTTEESPKEPFPVSKSSVLNLFLS